MRFDFNWVLGWDTDGEYRHFNTPKSVNNDVAIHHQHLMSTVVAIITTLVITSVASYALSNPYVSNVNILRGSPREVGVLSSVMDACSGVETREVLCEWVKSQRKNLGGFKEINFCDERKSSLNSNITEELCREEIARELLLGSPIHPSKRMMWAEAFPVAACCFCIIIWVLTYPLLCVNKQWLQRYIYYVIISSKILAVSSLLVRPLLLYLIPEFLWSIVIISSVVCTSTFALLYLDDRIRW